MYLALVKAAFEANGLHLDLGANEVSKLVEESCERVVLPARGESLAVALHNPKTAALAFDRIYRFPFLADQPPSEISFFCGTKPEVAVVAYLSVLMLGVRMGLLDEREPQTPLVYCLKNSVPKWP